jgi:glycine/D-amino acid oxidase-like deaminating enzyme
MLARRAVQAVVGEAVRRGVDFIAAVGEPPAGSGRVSQIQIGSQESIAAGEFVYACGPWLPKVFPRLLGDRIHATRQDVVFFSPPPGDRRFAPPQMPAWLHYGDPRGGYALPDLESRGFKLAFDRHGPSIDPDTMDRIVEEDAIAEARAFVRERFPALREAPVVETRVCQYENTSNGDFLLDRHPEFENVWWAGGGSGHGFKHGPAVGEYVEQLLSGTARVEPRFAYASKSAARGRVVY